MKSQKLFITEGISDHTISHNYTPLSQNLQPKSQDVNYKQLTQKCNELTEMSNRLRTKDLLCQYRQINCQLKEIRIKAQSEIDKINAVIGIDFKYLKKCFTNEIPVTYDLIYNRLSKQHQQWTAINQLAYQMKVKVNKIGDDIG